MKKIASAVLLLATAAFCFGQTPRAALSSSGASSDVYVGFIATSPDYASQGSSNCFFAIPIYGGEVAYTRYLSAHLGLTGAAAISGGTKFSVKEFSGTAGPRYNVLTGRFRPYATVQIGFAYQSSDGMYASDHHPPLAKGKRDVEDGFTYLWGGGADFQVSNHFYWRMAEWSVQPQPWGRHTPWYQNLGSGIGYRF
jgi:hypothetical protein